jgi:hypothetical protein
MIKKIFLGRALILAFTAVVIHFEAEGATVNLSNMTQPHLDLLVKSAALGLDHRALMPASPLGIAVGVDVGIETAFMSTPSELETAMTALTGTTGFSFPPLPRLNAHKGLPWGFDLGYSYIGYQSNSLMGMEVKWAFLQGTLVTPALALRSSYNILTAPMLYVSASTLKVDVVVSQSVTPFLTPYVGTGIQYYTGSFESPTSTLGALDASISSSTSGSAFHAYAGLPIHFFIVHMTGEYDYNFSTGGTFIAKVSVGF